MSRAAAALGVLAALALGACESTQEKAARMRAEGGQTLSRREGLKIGPSNREVKVIDEAIISDRNGTAVVVELRNSGPAQARVPLAIELSDAKGRRLFANDAPGLEPALTSVALLRARRSTYWVHNQISVTGRPRRLEVQVGRARGPAVPARLPRITLSKISLDRDSDGALARGTVINRSKVTQTRLTISAVARRRGRIVAAGRAVVDKLPPAPTPKPITFTVYFIGDPAGAKIDFTVPPVVLR